MDISGKVVNFLGDSITEGCGASRYENCYLSLFSKAHTDAVVNNYGISGTRITPQKTPSTPASFDRDFLGRVDEMDERADIVCVFGGTNDHGHGDAPFGKFGDETPETFCGALRCLTVKLLSRYPNKRVVFFTPLHKLGESAGAHASKDGKVMEEYVKGIRRNAEYFSLPVLDLWATAGMQPAVPIINETYFADGLHPNDFGHERLFKIIDGFIKSL